MPTLSIVIPTFKERDFLDRTLSQFNTLTIPHELIITDGGSTDGTLEIARRYTDKIVVWDTPRRQTFGEAKNAGAALATGEFIVCIDADVIIPSPQNFFAEMVAEFHAHKELVAMTVPLKPYAENHSVVDALFSAPLNWFYVISNNLFRSGNSSGEFQMVRREAFTAIKGFREHLAAGEDNELFRNLATIGRTRSYHKLCVTHSLRRPHKLGWLRTYSIWNKNGIHVALRGKAAYKEWQVVR